MSDNHYAIEAEFEQVQAFGNCEDLRRMKRAYRVYTRKGGHVGYVYKDGQGWHARDRDRTIFICQADRSRYEATEKLLNRLGQ